MSRIVKSLSVVDDRQNKEEAAKNQLEAQLTGMRILKNGALEAYGLQPRGEPPLTIDSLRDELNRLRAKVEEEKEALKQIRAQEREEREASEERRRAREAEDLAVDQVYQERLQEITEKRENLRGLYDEMIAEAQEKAEELREQARGEGYREGYVGGYETAQKVFREEAEPKLEELAGLITELTDYGPELMRQREREFIELAVTVAEKILNREIEADSAYIFDMLGELLSRNQREAYVNISVSPDMLPRQARASDEVLELLRERAQNVSVYVERDAPSGTLLMETPKGVTDLSISSQLENIKEALLEEQTVE